MGVIIPEDIKVLSNEFKDFVVELANEINRVSEAYTDLQRVRAMSPSQGGTSGPTDFLFFQVVSASREEPEDIGEEILAQKYVGNVFDSDGESVTIIAEEVDGYDFGVVRNEPTVMPDPAQIIGQDVHEEGTIICCKHYPALNTAVFSSVRPRLQVECDNEEPGVDK